MLLKDITKEALNVSIAAIDTETTGLDHRIARPVLFQYNSEIGTQIVRLGAELPRNIRTLLTSNKIQKVIHHAPFDLNMLYYNYREDFEDLLPANIIDTRIAAKYADPTKQLYGSHTLANLMDLLMGIYMEKETALSDWTQDLTEVQLTYAEKDVKYLIELWRKLEAELVAKGEIANFWIAMQHLPYNMLIDCAPINLSGVYGRI